MKKEHKKIIPRDDISYAFIKYLERELSKAGFKSRFEHMDPGGTDVHNYESGDKRTVVVTRNRIENDKDELKISSEWDGLAALLDSAADSFGREISRMIKEGK